MNIKFRHVVLAGILCLGLCSCGEGAPDYTKVQAQSGGAEQGQWRDSKGTLLDLNSGKFTYSKTGQATVTGTYTVNGTSITLAGDGGQSMTAKWPDPNSGITVDGETLTKTD